jgi:Spy/CpxP family protein refolding chaperone
MTRMAMLAVCSAALTSPLSVLAQDTTPPPPPPAGQHGEHGGQHMSAQEREAQQARQLQMMTTKLGLTDAQQTQIKQIYADNDSKMMALHEDNSIPQENKRAKMMGLMKERQMAVRAALTPQQQTKYDEMLAQMKEHMQHQGGRPGGPGGENTPPPPADAAPQQ